MLKVEPIKKYKSPNYPDKRVVLENPDILKTMPQRWKGKAFVGLTFSAIALFVLSGCQRTQTSGVPLPPVYLTEEEAYSIVLEEAGKYGVTFDKEGLELKDVEFLLDKQTSDDKTQQPFKFNVKLDGYEKEKRIGFEFVSENDVDEFNNSIERLNAQGIDSLWLDEYTDKLEKAIKDKEKEIYFDAFYTYGSGTTEDHKANLREQVKSFMEWLKAEGVL